MKRYRMNSRIRRCAAAAAVTAMAALLPVTMAGCKKAGTADTTVSSGEVETESRESQEEPADIRTATQTADGDASRMIESGGGLYFKYADSIRRIDEKTGEMKLLRSFEEGESNQAFWVYGGNLYFDLTTETDGSETTLYGLYKIDLETGEELHLADLMAQPTALYASNDRLYIRGYNVNIVYALDSDGKTAGELGPGETVYGQIPEGCRELYSGMLPYYVEHSGYMPVQNDTCLVIAKADGTDAREVPEVTNTSSVLFAKDCFFALFRDGSGNTECYRYDAASLERKLLFSSSENPQLVQYRDGALYYMVNNITQIISSDAAFYQVSVKDGTIEQVVSMKEEPGMTGSYGYYGSFYAAEDAVYCQKIKDYGIYMSRTDLASKEEIMLEPVLFQSPVSSLGKVDSTSGTIPCACGEYTAAKYYVERLIFDGDSEAATAMNEVMEQAQQEILGYVKEMVPSGDEEWLHSDEAHASSMTYVVQGITYLDENYACIEMDGYEYTGGAHGMPFKDYFVFDRRTGARLSLGDIVDNTQEELQPLVGHAFRRLAEKTNFAFESPADLEHTVSDSVSYESDFYLTEQGVVFYYTPYAIAPYAEGFPEVVIPYDELKLKIELQ